VGNTFQIRGLCHPERSEGSLSGERSFAALRMTLLNRLRLTCKTSYLKCIGPGPCTLIGYGYSVKAVTKTRRLADSVMKPVSHVDVLKFCPVALKCCALRSHNQKRSDTMRLAPRTGCQPHCVASLKILLGTAQNRPDKANLIVRIIFTQKFLDRLEHITAYLL